MHVNFISPQTRQGFDGITGLSGAIALYKCIDKEDKVSDKPKMNLAERRAVADYKESTFSKKLQDLHTAAGFPVAVEVDWESIAVSGQQDFYARDDYWTDIFFNPTAKALGEVTADAMGKEALTAELKSIKFHYDEATAPSMAFENGVRFEDGVLTINFKPFSNADYIDDRAKAIRTTLEAAL